MKTKIKIIITLIILVIVFLLYGPIKSFRTFFITSSMTSMNHQYLAKFFYDEQTIYKVLENNKTLSKENITNKELIEIYSQKPNIMMNKYEKEILTKEKNNDLYKIIDINGKGYHGYLVVIYDPSKIKIETSKNIGVEGEKITSVYKRTKAKIIINASGYFDYKHKGNGAIPHGIVIKKGKIISDNKPSGVDGGFIGFTNDNKLVLAKTKRKNLGKINYRDAVEFGPFLIVNKKQSIIKGNGGLGTANRTAIAQRKDGIVLFLVIDGRSISSIGADMKDLVEIFKRYNAYNAANLDGGSSTQALVNGKIINNPTGGGDDNLRKMPVFFVVE